MFKKMLERPLHSAYFVLVSEVLHLITVLVVVILWAIFDVSEIIGWELTETIEMWAFKWEGLWLVLTVWMAVSFLIVHIRQKITAPKEDEVSSEAFKNGYIYGLVEFVMDAVPYGGDYDENTDSYYVYKRVSAIIHDEKFHTNGQTLPRCVYQIFTSLYNIEG